MQYSSLLICFLISICASVIAMEKKQSEHSLNESETIKLQAQKKLITYLKSNDIDDEDQQERENVAFMLDRWFSENEWGLSSEKFPLDENVPGENYTFSQLRNDLIHRYRLTIVKNSYRVLQINRSRPPKT